MKEFTKEQLKQISELKVECSHSMGGYNRSLHWGFYEGGIYAEYYYESRDCDGDWGTSCTRNSNISFDELIETMKNPMSKFDTRSWN